jgi:uncharacterized glyoxalase superfamily protein PhnB
MRYTLVVILLLAALRGGRAQQPQIAKEPTMKITPMIYVPAVEPSLAFWVDRLGFTKTAEVPDGPKLAFAMLNHGSAEVMIQTISSAQKDANAFTEYARPAACLYIEVEDFNDLLKRLESAPVVLPVRDTFYGMREIGVREPGGNLVLFAAPLKK